MQIFPSLQSVATWQFPATQAPFEQTWPAPYALWQGGSLEHATQDQVAVSHSLPFGQSVATRQVPGMQTPLMHRLPLPQLASVVQGPQEWFVQT
jgi:hypothetical protein